MPSLYDFWTPIYNAFDPQEALRGEKLQRYFVEREGSPLDKLSAESHAAST